jgi:vitamin B12 transporter
MSFRRTLAAPALPALLAVVFAVPVVASPVVPADPEATPQEQFQEEPPSDPDRPTGPPVEEEIVVTASRSPEPAREAGSSVTVFDREEIERRGVATVLELLRTVPGVEVSQGGGPGRVASVFLRGATSAQTLVLLDGVRLNSPTTAAFDLADLTVDGVERVEVLRGPQSVLYGSEAMGGVVAITTRRGSQGLAGGVEGEAGSLGLAAGRADLRGAGGRFDYALAAARLELDGVSAASERRGNTEEDRWRNTTLSGRLGTAFLGDGRADLTARHADGETGLDGFTFGVGPTDDPNYLQRRELTQIALELSKPLAPWWRQELTLGTSEDDLVGEDPDTPFHPFDIRTRVAEASTRADLALGDRNRLLAGAAVERREAENAGAFDESLDLVSFFANHRWSARERLFLSAGLRHDDASGFGSKTTWRATGALLFPGRGAHPSNGARLHGSYGTGFRVPTFNELFFPGLGNLELEPETSAGWDLGLERTFRDGRLRLDLTAFENRFDELIVFDLATFTFANVAEAESRGVEATAAAETARRWQLAASWTWNETEDLATGRPLPRQPEHRGTLVATLRASERLRATATVVAVAERIDSDGSPMDDYQRLDLAAQYRLGRHLRPYLGIDNLLDQDYEEVNGFTTPGRTLRLGLRAEL